ncbi:MAG: flagellar biosynthetic protein FliO [Polyangiales bacterium]
MSADWFGLAQAICALLLLGALVWLVRRTGFGVLVPRKNRLLEVEERLPLDLRNGLVIARVEGRRILLAVSDHGPARLLLELPKIPDDA